MELFDKKFVHFMWDDELEGKEGFFADSIITLMSDVISDNYRGVVSKLESDEFPFLRVENDTNWMFFYYDPLYKYKKAFNEGKTIQIKDNIHNKWRDVKYENILWGENAETGEYRIKPEEPKTRLMTYRELAEWLAKGNGQVKVGGEVHIWFDYVDSTDDIDVGYEIRRWGSDKWIKPIVDVYEEDVKNGGVND